MQNRYVGDIGDFVKYALLRHLSDGKKLGIAWYLHPNEESSNDGRYVQYLDRPAEWRHLDEDLFDSMRRIVVSGHRSISKVQAESIFHDAVFAEECLDISSVRVSCRPGKRKDWFDAVRERLKVCDIVFADPDNGLFPDSRFRPTVKRSAKSIPENEVRELSQGGRPIVIYHHNTRRKGGHRAEIADWRRRLPGKVYAYYWRRWSNRTFFVANCKHWTIKRLEVFAKRWHPSGELIHPPKKLRELNK